MILLHGSTDDDITFNPLKQIDAVFFAPFAEEILCHCLMTHIIKRGSNSKAICILTAIVTSVFWILPHNYAPLTSLRIFFISMTATAFISPIAEELIFRLSVITILLIAAEKSAIKKVFAVVISCLPWIGIHFPRTSARFVDLVITGFVISVIYMLSKNIVYSIAFHMSANITTMLAMPVGKLLPANSYLMYVVIAIVAVCLPVALVRMQNRTAYSCFVVERNSV